MHGVVTAKRVARALHEADCKVKRLDLEIKLQLGSAVLMENDPKLDIDE